MGKIFGGLIGAVVFAFWLGSPIYEDYTWHEEIISEMEKNGISYNLTRGGALFAPWTLIASHVNQINFYAVENVGDIRLGTHGFIRRETMGETEPGVKWAFWANCKERMYKDANITGLSNDEASNRFAEAKINAISGGVPPNEIMAYAQAQAFKKVCGN